MTKSLVLRKTQDVERYRPAPARHDEFHLQFMKPPMSSGGFEKGDVDYFLRRVFAGNAPLECEYLRVRQCNGEDIAQVS